MERNIIVACQMFRHKMRQAVAIDLDGCSVSSDFPTLDELIDLAEEVDRIENNLIWSLNRGEHALDEDIADLKDIVTEYRYRDMLPEIVGRCSESNPEVFLALAMDKFWDMISDATGFKDEESEESVPEPELSRASTVEI